MADAQTQNQQAQARAVSGLDPDFLLMAFLAILVDVLDWIFEIGTVVSLVIGLGFVAWLAWREGKKSGSGELVGQAQGLQEEHLQIQAQRRMAKQAVKRAWRRGLLVFAAELVPLLNLIPFWTLFVFSALRPTSGLQAKAEEFPSYAET